MSRSLPLPEYSPAPWKIEEPTTLYGEAYERHSKELRAALGIHAITSDAKTRSGGWWRGRIMGQTTEIGCEHTHEFYGGDALRIVACVNACEGIPTGTLAKIGAVRDQSSRLARLSATAAKKASKA